MSFQLSLEEGQFLVKLARSAVEAYLNNGETLKVPDATPPKLMENCGVFVTLDKVSQGRRELRGCIGFPYPTTPLAQAVIEAANSASHDPRFPPVSVEELDYIVFEVSVLTPPQLINVENPVHYPSQVEVGQDGLIIERGYRKGLLLPQVPIEWNWDSEEFLCQCCVKAGLPPDCWLLHETKVYSFQALLYEEIVPRGDIKQITLK